VSSANLNVLYLSILSAMVWRVAFVWAASTAAMLNERTTHVGEVHNMMDKWNNMMDENDNTTDKYTNIKDAYYNMKGEL
jgi:hypothetical protein